MEGVTDSDDKIYIAGGDGTIKHFANDINDYCCEDAEKIRAINSKKKIN